MEEPIIFNIIDYETAAFNKSYLMLRVRQEMSRVKRSNSSVSLALIKIGHLGLMNESSTRIPVEVLRHITVLLRSTLREEDVLTRFDETTFALLLPDTTGQSAQLLLETVRTKIEENENSLDGIESRPKLYIQSAVGIADYDGDDINADALVAQAASALKNAVNTTNGTVSLFSLASAHMTGQRNGKTGLGRQPQPT